MTYPALKDRYNKIDITKDHISPYEFVNIPSAELNAKISDIADHIIHAKSMGASVICTFGAHTIKNGLGIVLGEFIKNRWFTHLATNGAGVIHDWEFAFQGKSSEDVRENVKAGKFGTWDETGLFINLALMVGAYEGSGYGEAVGSLIVHNGVNIPDTDELLHTIKSLSIDSMNDDEKIRHTAAAADLLELIRFLDLPPGFYPVNHPFADYSLQALSYRLGVPFTSHPMFGHDIIYTHKANRGSAVGRTAERDFLSFANSVSGLSGGVYISVGSSVMSPMIFEKSLSMARNVLLSEGTALEDCAIYVIDLQGQTWDWTKGEPSEDNPAYYLRFMKSFSRMGCPYEYISIDNRIFFLGLLHTLLERKDTHEY